MIDEETGAAIMALSERAAIFLDKDDSWKVADNEFLAIVKIMVKFTLEEIGCIKTR